MKMKELIALLSMKSSVFYVELCAQNSLGYVYVDICKCITQAEQISISVPLNVKIFSCDCMTEYERVPAALHCDSMRRKSSGMYTA